MLFFYLQFLSMAKGSAIITFVYKLKLSLVLSWRYCQRCCVGPYDNPYGNWTTFAQVERGSKVSWDEYGFQKRLSLCCVHM
jgi:hypothetical protein